MKQLKWLICGIGLVLVSNGAWAGESLVAATVTSKAQMVWKQILSEVKTQYGEAALEKVRKAPKGSLGALATQYPLAVTLKKAAESMSGAKAEEDERKGHCSGTGTAVDCAMLCY